MSKWFSAAGVWLLLSMTALATQAQEVKLVFDKPEDFDLVDELRFDIKVQEIDENGDTTLKNFLGPFEDFDDYQVEVDEGYAIYDKIYFNRNKAYKNNGWVTVELNSYFGKKIATDSFQIPVPTKFALNYLEQPGNAGERLRLDLKAILSNGAIRSTTNCRALCWDDFIITCRGDTIDPLFFFIPSFIDSPSVVYLKTQFLGDTSVQHVLDINVSYKPELYIDLKGEEGKAGEPGQSANRFNELINGLDGKPGWNGAAAMDLNVALIPLEDENGKVILKCIFLSNYFEHSVFIDPEVGNLTINLSGGKGGAGGMGGQGKNGVDSAQTLEAARSGSGGDGANGGFGGNAGSMKLITNQEGKAYAGKIKLVNNPGMGGKGGAAGKHGKHGSIHPDLVKSRLWFKIFKPKKGIDGQPGSDGGRGYGQQKPELWLVDDEELLGIYESSLNN